MRFVQCVTLTTEKQYFDWLSPQHFHTDILAHEHDLHAAHMQVHFDILQSPKHHPRNESSIKADNHGFQHFHYTRTHIL